MQLASAVTEYILPGIPLVAALIYGADELTTWPVRDLLAAKEGDTIAVSLTVLLLAVAYPLGVMVHYIARWVFLPWYNDEEHKAWKRFELHCKPKLKLLGSDICHELATLESDQLGDGGWSYQELRGGIVTQVVRSICAGRLPDQHPRDLSGWILWRMRLLLCSRAPAAAQEVLHLQAISRAARGAFALPLSLAMGAFVRVVGHICDPSGFTPPTGSTGDWLLLICLLPLSLGLMRAVGRTYVYRWNVVCRGTIAAFLSLDSGHPQLERASGDWGDGSPAGSPPN